MAIGPRISAPADYKWRTQMFLDTLRKNPLDLIVVIIFISHIIGYFCLLIILKFRSRRKKLFAVSQ